MPLLLMISEIMLIYYFVQFFGFFELILFYAITTFLGVLVLRWAGANSLKQFQVGAVKEPNKSMLSQGLLFLSGLMLMVPSMMTKVFGAILVLPPVRWLASVAFMGFLLKKVFTQNSFIHQFGNNGFKFYYSGGGNPFENQQNPTSYPNDDTVIDADFRKIEDTKLLK